jgi:serine/threonine-protein kinase
MRVALKTITPASEGSPDAVERFLREASILRQLDHPNIVQFREVGSSAGRLFFAMEFVPGLDGSEMIKKNGGPLPVVRAVRLIHQALDGLAYAHDRGFVHRDIKPTNLLIGDEGGTERAKLADFGLARIYHTSPLSGLTLTGQFGGTYGFIAPEQITNYRDVKPATDQYSVGATLYTMLTGEKIYDFRGGIAQQILTVLQEDPVPVRERRSDIPEALAAVVHRALARDPASRYPGADAMRRALDPFLGGG